jgi:methyl-accepting chemotaxis protein
MKITLKSIQWKILLWTGLSMLAAVTIVASLSVILLRQTAIQAARERAATDGLLAANIYAAHLSEALHAAQTLAQVFMSAKSGGIALNRDQANAIMRQVLQENPEFLGISTAWEPNGFDAEDERFRNLRGADANGRFIPHWIRSGDLINVVALVDFENLGGGAFYQVVKEARQDAILEPYELEVSITERVLITTVVVPIVVNQKFYGVVGWISRWIRSRPTQTAAPALTCRRSCC